MKVSGPVNELFSLVVINLKFRKLDELGIRPGQGQVGLEYLSAEMFRARA